MPEPPASSWPDQETVKQGVVSVAGSAVTLLVGRAASMVLRSRWRCQRRVGVEDDRRLLVDGGAGGQARLGLDRVLDVALADMAAVVGRQEAVEDAGRAPGR